jgi:hypothetical protein
LKGRSGVGPLRGFLGAGPFDQVDEDPARADLDRRLLADVLELSPAICEVGGPMELLRRKLAAEPQIHGDKQTRLVFTRDGEENVKRDPVTAV